MDIANIQPYGFMAHNFERALGDRVVPKAWPPGENLESWIDRERDLLAQLAWPWWDRQHGWQGAAKSTALDLTRADLDLMRRLADENFRFTARHGDGHTHAWWFQLEDSLFKNWDRRHPGCFPASKVALDKFEYWFGFGGTDGLCGCIHWKLKSQLQRPRPAQMAWLLGKPSPGQRYSSSAWSPSAISGHAFQGLMACISVHRAVGGQLSTAEIEQLKRLAVDIADRRVYAGLHYPSDNAMSWRVALDALGKMRIETATLQFAQAAIEGSDVFRAMEQSPQEPLRRCAKMVRDAFT
jgi:hypothetical protein